MEIKGDYRITTENLPIPVTDKRNFGTQTPESLKSIAQAYREYIGELERLSEDASRQYNEHIVMKNLGRIKRRLAEGIVEDGGVVPIT